MSERAFTGVPSLPRASVPFRIAPWVCLVALVSYLAARVGGELAIRPLMIWPLWPGNAILVSILLLVPRRIWPMLIAAAFAAYIFFDLQTGLPVRVIGLLILADTAEVLMAAFGVTYFFDGIPNLNSVKALAKFSLFAVILAPLAVAFIGSFTSSGNYWTAWRASFLSEALAFLIIVPAILGWFQKGSEWKQKSHRFAEAIALLTALILVGYLTFDTFRRGYSPVLLYSLVPFLMWAALRFGSTGISSSMIVIGFLSIRGALHGQGPFNGADALTNLSSLQLFLLFTSAAFMVLAVLATERKQAEREQKKSEEKFSKVFRESPMAVTVTSARDHRYIDVNETFERITGYRREEILGRTPFDIGIWVQPSDRIELVNQLLKSGSLRNIEHTFRTKSGEIRAGFSSAELIEIEGEPCMLAVIDDITERKQTEEHFRLVVESAPNGLVIMDQQGGIVLVNAQVEILFSYRREELAGQSIDTLVPEFLRMDHARTRNEFVRHPTGRPIGVRRDLLARRKDGTEFYVEVGLTPLNTREGPRIMCSIVDVTERMLAEQALRESEERFRLVANSAPVMIWMSGSDKLCTFFNQGWLEFTGRALDDELGAGWATGVHPEDLDRCLKTYSEAFDARVAFRMEYRLRRHDGQYRWVFDYGVPRLEADRGFQGYIGTVIDITDRRLSEEALLDMSGRLISAHEEERHRIARELHDDLSQRMALLEIGLEQFEQETPRLSSTSRHRLHAIVEVATQVSTDIHNLSHELHPAKLEALGLVPTVEEFCREFSKQHDLRIQFVNHGVREQISEDVALCIFRIIQEALRNVVKHSRADEASVQLSDHSDRIELCVMDSGPGFDPGSAVGGGGLGLISMRERLRLVGGQLSVESAVLQGTRVRCSIPLSANRPEPTGQMRAKKSGA